jgi:hypothetical protein
MNQREQMAADSATAQLFSGITSKCNSKFSTKINYRFQMEVTTDSSTTVKFTSKCMRHFEAWGQFELFTVEANINYLAF